MVSISALRRVISRPGWARRTACWSQPRRGTGPRRRGPFEPPAGGRPAHEPPPPHGPGERKKDPPLEMNLKEGLHPIQDEKQAETAGNRKRKGSDGQGQPVSFRRPAVE